MVFATFLIFTTANNIAPNFSPQVLDDSARQKVARIFEPISGYNYPLVTMIPRLTGIVIST